MLAALAAAAGAEPYVVTQACDVYELTKVGADDVEQRAFGMVLVVANALCLVVCFAMILMSMDKMRYRVAKCCGGRGGGRGNGTSGAGRKAGSDASAMTESNRNLTSVAPTRDWE